MRDRSLKLLLILLVGFSLTACSAVRPKAEAEEASPPAKRSALRTPENKAGFGAAGAFVQ